MPSWYNLSVISSQTASVPFKSGPYCTILQWARLATIKVNPTDEPIAPNSTWDHNHNGTKTWHKEKVMRKFFFALLLIKLTVSPIRLLVRFQNRHFSPGTLTAAPLKRTWNTSHWRHLVCKASLLVFWRWTWSPGVSTCYSMCCHQGMTPPALIYKLVLWANETQNLSSPSWCTE